MAFGDNAGLVGGRRRRRSRTNRRSRGKSGGRAPISCPKHTRKACLPVGSKLLRRYKRYLRNLKNRRSKSHRKH